MWKKHSRQSFGIPFPQVAEDETPQVAMHDVHRLSPPLELQNHFMMIFMMIFKSH